MGPRKTLAVAGLALFAVSLVGQRRSRARRLCREAAADEEARRAEKRSNCIADDALPVDVNPQKLPTGWSAAPPVYYAAEQLAVIPLVTPQENLALEEQEAQHTSAVRVPTSSGKSERANGSADKECDGARVPQQSAYILCGGPSWELLEQSVKRSVNADDALVKHVLQVCTPLRQLVAGQEVKVEELGSFIPTSKNATEAEPPFTHVVRVKGEAEQSPPTLLLVGLHGPYYCVAVLTGFPDIPSTASENASSLRRRVAHADQNEQGEAQDSGESVLNTASLQCAARAITEAAFTVPHAAQTPSLRHPAGRFALPGTPVGAHQGQYRVTLTDGERTIVLSAPTGLVVRSVVSDRDKGGIVWFEGHSEVSGERVSCIVTKDMAGSLVDAEQTLAAACPEACSSASAAERELMERISVLSVLNAKDRVSSQYQVTVLYTHPQLKTFFRVDDQVGEVLDPIVTDAAQVLYFPCGRGAKEGEVCMTIQEHTSFPPTWEAVLKDDDELVHNVRFHFTEWDRERVDCTVAELSGLKCVQFTETKEGVRCRSYVVPRAKTILVIRSEAPVEAFETHMRMLQIFLDTLHIDA